MARKTRQTAQRIKTFRKTIDTLVNSKDDFSQTESISSWEERVAARLMNNSYTTAVSLFDHEKRPKQYVTHLVGLLQNEQSAMKSEDHFERTFARVVFRAYLDVMEKYCAFFPSAKRYVPSEFKTILYR